MPERATAAVERSKGRIEVGDGAVDRLPYAKVEAGDQSSCSANDYISRTSGIADRSRDIRCIAAESACKHGSIGDCAAGKLRVDQIEGSLRIGMSALALAEAGRDAVTDGGR